MSWNYNFNFIECWRTTIAGLFELFNWIDNEGNKIIDNEGNYIVFNVEV